MQKYSPPPPTKRHRVVEGGGVIVGAVVGVIVVVAAVAFVMTKRTAKESDGATVSTEVASDVQNPNQVL
jgi:hypothetical protein